MKILCGTNFSVHANHTALAAATLTARFQGTLMLAHVLDTSRYSNPSKDFLEHLRYSRRNKLAVLAERARHRGANVETHLDEGNPGTRLAALAHEWGARLLLLGSAGQISPSEWFTSSVADQVIQSALGPMLIVRNPKSIEAWARKERPLKVVVAYDFSPSSEAALHWIRSLRTICECEITVLYVASPTNGQVRLGVAPPMSPLYYPSGLKVFLRKELEQKCNAVLGPGAARACVRPDWGNPDAQVIEAAVEDRADLIIVGTSQRKGFARLGSTSRAILHYAPVNVACVPFPANDCILARKGPSPATTFVAGKPSRHTNEIKTRKPTSPELVTTAEKITGNSSH